MSRPDLVSVFSWCAFDDEARRRRVELLAGVGRDLALALDDAERRFACPGSVGALRAALTHADDITLVRVLGAPDVCRAAASYHVAPDRALLEQLDGWFAIEAALRDGRRSLDAPQWSALGDAYLPGLRTEPDDWGVCGPTRAPLTRGGILVDFDSPSARRVPRSSEDRALAPEAPVPLSAVARAATLAKLDRALGALAAACPAAYNFTVVLTPAIVARGDAANPTAWTSSSNRTAIGRTVLSNPHLASTSVARIVSALVHEAIHAYLYIEERSHPLGTDWDRVFEIEVASPWSGTVLTLQHYLHACFVWHGLRMLWRVPAFDAELGATAVRRERELAERGFARGILAPLAEHRALVAPAVWDALARIDALDALDALDRDAAHPSPRYSPPVTTSTLAPASASPSGSA